MPIEIDGIKFVGPYLSTILFENKPGVYVVLCGYSGKKIIDVGESAKVKERLERHDRKDCEKILSLLQG